MKSKRKRKKKQSKTKVESKFLLAEKKRKVRV